MKVGILSFCNGYNYGAILQCYALQKYLISNGIDAEVINFKKEKKYNKNGINLLSPAYTLRKIYAMWYKKSINQKRQKFDSFFENKISNFPAEPTNEDNISYYTKKYDVIIFGSDQIWNLDDKIYDNSKIFFGDFDFNGTKIAYAASFGDSISIAQNNINYIKKMLLNFSAISVREETGNEFLNSNGIKSVHVVDPTLLLNQIDWEKLCKKSTYKKIPEKYILYYSVNCRKYSWLIAKKLSKKTGLKVINLEEHPKIVGAHFINDYTEGPNEFLSLIKNAEYVVTNSFHGTIFSLIFKKKLIPVFDTKDGKIVKEERKYSILSCAGLLDIITTINDKIDISKYENIDYKMVSRKIKESVDLSRKYLLDSLGDIND